MKRNPYTACHYVSHISSGMIHRQDHKLRSDVSMSCDVLSPSVLSCTVLDARASRGGVCSRDLWFELVSSAVPGGLKTTVRNGFARVPDNVFSRDSLLIRALPSGINQSDIARCRYTATCTVYIGHRSKEDACDSKERREREGKIKKKKNNK